MAKKGIEIIRYGDAEEQKRREDIVDLVRNSPIPDSEYMMNLGLFLTPQTLSRILFMDFLYRKSLEIQGVIFDLGCRWGQNASLFSAMRGIYEPFNRIRKVVAFDTFSGHLDLNKKDKGSMEKGQYSVTKGYEKYLDKILAFQEQESPLSHIKKYEIIKGDASKTVPDYLKKHQETIISLAYFDFDVYKPTIDTLNAIKGSLTKGSVIGFDELCEPACPGETVALKEALGLDKFSIKRYPYNARSSYLIVE